MSRDVPVPAREAPIVNYDGISFVFIFQGRYFFALKNSNISHSVEVSKSFYKSFVREFGNEFKGTDETITVCIDELRKHTAEFCMMRRT